MSRRDVAAFVRPELRRHSAYLLERGSWRFRLDQNEPPWPLPVGVRRRITERLARRDWSIYPEFHSETLCRALAEHHGHPWEGILAGNGSGELLELVIDAVTPPGGEVLGTLPSFSLYRLLVERAGGVPRFVGPRPDALLPIDALRAEVERDPRRPVILCSPNNPTGDALAPARVEALLERLDAPLLLDNAYAEFCRHDYRPLLARHRHLILFGTFSKAWSLAGLRLGYLLADPELVGELLKVKLPYTVDHAAEVAGLEALAAAPRLARRVRAVVGRRRQWGEMLARYGFEVFPSEANFLLVRCPGGDAAGCLRHLAERGILVRNVGGYPGLAGCLRIAVGSGAALRATDAALAEWTPSKEK